MRLSPAELIQLASFVVARLEEDEAEVCNQVYPDEALSDVCQMTREVFKRIDETGGVSAMSERTEMILRRVALRHRDHPNYDLYWRPETWFST